MTILEELELKFANGVEQALFSREEYNMLVEYIRRLERDVESAETARDFWWDEAHGYNSENY